MYTSSEDRPASAGSQASDGEILARSIAHPDCFWTLFERHYALVRRFAGARLASEMAEDVATTTFMQAFDLRHRFDGRDDARPWLLGIATNLVRRQRRAEASFVKAAARTAGDERLAHDEHESGIGRADAGSMRNALAGALAELRREERDVLVLFALCELSYPEIASALGLSEGTVRSRLSRARSRLRGLLDPYVSPAAPSEAPR